MVPILPCSSIDEMGDFYLHLGFEVTYRQLRPNPYLALRRGGVELHYFGMDGFKPEDSYGSCLVLVKDTEPLFEEFAAGLRAQFGKLPLTGFPRITRPRRRKNAGNLSGFSLIDPSGNWIRVMSEPDAPQTSVSPGGKLAMALANAVVFADSHGDVDQAEKILARAVKHEYPDTTKVELIEALVYLAELYVRLEDLDAAQRLLGEIEATELSEAEREMAAPLLEQARDLRESAVRTAPTDENRTRTGADHK